MPPPKFDAANRIVVVDLEATCDDRGAVPKHEMEIIEIGAVLLEADLVTVVAELQRFVRPVRHPALTPFCTQLTTIRQLDVDAARPFSHVIADLGRWLFAGGTTVFASWGDYDRKQLQQDCAFHGVPYPMPERHLNVKALFSETRGIKKRLGMAEALTHAGLTLDGTHHRGIDDARNIARLLPFAVR
jgi:inhibitor of KinA sporulation pathway (predicted exonuclease)